MSTETIKWIPVGDSRPDDDTTVLLYDPDADEPVWPGYYGECENDGLANGWRYVEGMPATPTHWAHLPAGPADAKVTIPLATLRRRCRTAATYLTDPQFDIAWRKTVKAAKVTAGGYPRDLVDDLTIAITDRAGFWADPNEARAA